MQFFRTERPRLEMLFLLGFLLTDSKSTFLPPAGRRSAALRRGLFSCHILKIGLHPCGAVFLHLLGDMTVNVGGERPPCSARVPGNQAQSSLAASGVSLCLSVQIMDMGFPAQRPLSRVDTNGSSRCRAVFFTRPASCGAGCRLSADNAVFYRCS